MQLRHKQSAAQHNSLILLPSLAAPSLSQDKNNQQVLQALLIFMSFTPGNCSWESPGIALRWGVGEGPGWNVPPWLLNLDLPAAFVFPLSVHVEVMVFWWVNCSCDGLGRRWLGVFTYYCLSFVLLFKCAGELLARKIFYHIYLLLLEFLPSCSGSLWQKHLTEKVLKSP